VWFLYRQQIQQYEQFVSSPSDCVIYYTKNKKACDAGFYLLPKTEFNIYLRNSKLKSDFDLDTVNKEREGNVGRVCKLDYKGWTIDPNIQPTDNVADTAVINARGNVNTWMMCRKNILPKSTSPGQLYNQTNVQKEYENHQNIFGNYQNVSIEKAPFTPIPTNIGKPLDQASPEYIHMYFTSSTIKDTNSVCKNPTVDNTSYIPLMAPQYGLELGISTQTNDFTINRINLIKTLSRGDNSHFVYENGWQNPNMDILVKLFYSIGVNVNTKTVSYNAQNIQMTLYKLILNECNKLINLSSLPNMGNNVNTYNFGTLFKLPRYDIVTKYPFGSRLPQDERNKEIYEKTNITYYNPITIRNLNSLLERYIRTLESDYTRRLNSIRLINNFKKQYGFSYETYTVPSTLKTTVATTSKTSSIFTKTQIKRSIFQNDFYKRDYAAIHNSNGFIFNAKNNEFTIVKTHLILPNKVSAGTYKFQLHIQGHNVNTRPAKFYVQALYNGKNVGSYYYCNQIDICKQKQNESKQKIAKKYGIKSARYKKIIKQINANTCYKNKKLCKVVSPVKLEFPLKLSTNINLNKLEIRIYSNYPRNVPNLRVGLYCKIKNKWNIYPKNTYSYNVRDYHPTSAAVFYDKKKYYYPAKARIAQNNILVRTVNAATTSFKQQLKNNIMNTYINAFNWFGVNNRNTDDFRFRYLSGNDKVYMLFTTPKTYTQTTIDNRAIEDFNKYVLTN